ncbi:uncharacterized protein LOC104891155 isoform X1 [Beta vulgaris subsp. vulgaris]|uniref:uncharacterized protein LOC104891155 isoform X1 n=2 Tax=Beta vulgaris subsp. vulgaris TaxID=3555 RepID=UPI002549BC36|nr:uncharacterized protein LOC104891155 isoform X1 [Beta vulgaris subsp. vulgaris]
MVTNSSNRSPSTNTNTNTNPIHNSRNNQEREGAGVRKSFSGYPSAKSSPISTNSRAENARRSSFGRENGDEQKENERDLNLKPVSKIRSPLISKGGSGTKNFMSPTISAASKINPSPRKKVLGERNEAIRTSASLSHGKFHFFSMNSLEFGDEAEQKSVMEMESLPISTTTTVTNFNNKGTDQVSITESEVNMDGFSHGNGKIETGPDFDSDLVVLDSEVVPMNAANSSEPLPLSDKIADDNVSVEDMNNSCKIAPLGSLPPYDPQTNYLSPRPQFLRYKPNSRIESYINHGTRLEDDFSSESVDSEEVQSDDVESENATVSSSVELTSPIGVEEDSSSSEINSTEIQPETVELNIEPKPWFSRKWRTAALLLLILFGSISMFVIFSPSFENAMYCDKVISRIYHDPHAVVDLAKTNLNGLFQYAMLWSVHSVGYLSNMIHNARDVNQFSPLPFSNMTAGLQEMEFGDFEVKDFAFWTSLERKEDGGSSLPPFTDLKMENLVLSIEPEELNETSELEDSVLDTEPVEESAIDTEPVEESAIDTEPVEESAIDTEPVEESAIDTEPVEDFALDSKPENLEEISVLDTEPVEDSEFDDKSENLEDISVVVNDDSTAHVSEEATSIDEAVNQELKAGKDLTVYIEDEPPSAVKVEDQLLSSPFEVYSQVVKALGEETDLSSGDGIIELEELHELNDRKSQVFESNDGNSQVRESTDGSLSWIISVVSLVAVSLLAATTFMYAKTKKETPELADPLVDKEKSTTYKAAASMMKASLNEKPSSFSDAVEVDMVGESCPSEMSSCQKNTPSHNKHAGRENDEAQSQSVDRSLRVKGGNEVQSQSVDRSKKNYKRESLAASSDYTMTSSYGSFTSYSILHLKHGDEEVVTPVRRSSRIRTKITSP